MKKRVTGIGGIFFKAQEQAQSKEWYAKHLGIASESWGSLFKWRDHAEPEKECTTTWTIFPKDTDNFLPGKQDFMVNYRVENLVDLLKALKEEGVEIVGEMQEFEYGKFAWIMDPDGNKIELWEPIDAPFL